MTALKKVKQQINAQCHQMGRHYDPAKNKWTGEHLRWLRKIQFPDHYQQLALDERLAQYDTLTANIERYNAEIEEIAKMERYEEKADHLCCLLGVKKHTAVALMSEIGDFRRFDKGSTFAAFLGLAPGEHSSGDHTCRTSISKAGNSHLRRHMVEAAQGICRGKIGHKSKALKARQAGSPANVIAYADAANKRMRTKYYRLDRQGKQKNVAVTAIARELACCVWGIMTDNIEPKTA